MHFYKKVYKLRSFTRSMAGDIVGYLAAEGEELDERVRSRLGLCNVEFRLNATLEDPETRNVFEINEISRMSREIAGIVVSMNPGADKKITPFIYDRENRICYLENSADVPSPDCEIIKELIEKFYSLKNLLGIK